METFFIRGLALIDQEINVTLRWQTEDNKTFVRGAFTTENIDFPFST